MMNRPIEGIVATATRGRSGFGQVVFKNVTICRGDGVEQRLGGVMVAEKLADALAPGQQGRFYFHDMMGSQGLHGFTAQGGTPRIAFPRLVENVFAILALLNLAVVSAIISWTGALQLVPLTVGVMATIAWATCRGAREAIMHDVRWESRVTAARTHRQAVMGRG